MSASGPVKQYQLGVEAGDIVFDPAQFQAAEYLQALYDELTESPQAPGLLARLLRRPERPAVKGLYFWGGVGRGKTYLMDVFYETLPFEEKTRLHFHRFMRGVHHELQAVQGESDPLEQIAADFANRSRVLCFDEFFVSDITDAMILAGLLDGLFSRGVVLVATSNVAPDRLYENGLQRRKFLPAIELLKTHTRIVNLDGDIDYRLRALELAEIYHYPLDEQADTSLARSFESLSPDRGEADVTLEIEGRPVSARLCGDGVAWFDFPELCDGPRSQNDYIELARIFQTILISNVPVFDTRKEDQARRFISLVDEFYDHNVKLILSAEAPVTELYRGNRLKFEFQRTESRLQEMQSHDYLAREHRP
ncbi:MAG: cell division protein ZapE [Pseudomonadales bacterium]